MPRLRALRDRIVGIAPRIERFEARQKDFERRRKLETKALLHRLEVVEANVQALVRRSLDVPDLPYPERLTLQRFGLHSQNHEDGVTFALLAEGVVETRRFAELGCGDNGGSSGFLAAELGWSGLMVDAAEDDLARLRGSLGPKVAVVQKWLDVESVNQLLVENGCEGEIDVLGIDIDGNDYWLWEAIEVTSPRLVIVEYNSIFGAERAVAVPYDRDFRRVDLEGMKGMYYGASLRALTLLGERKGYRLVAVEPSGVNGFFLRNDVATHVPGCDPDESFRMLDKHARLVAEGFDVWRAAEEHGLTLIDLTP